MLLHFNGLQLKQHNRQYMPYYLMELQLSISECNCKTEEIFSTHFPFSHHDTARYARFKLSPSYFTVSPSLQVVVQVKPVYTPPQLLPIGRETITYIATDRSGNQANCSFTVTVIGELSGETMTLLILVRIRKR